MIYENKYQVEEESKNLTKILPFVDCVVENFL